MPTPSPQLEPEPSASVRFWIEELTDFTPEQVENVLEKIQQQPSDPQSLPSSV
jgi:hypothetical protein